MGKGNKQTTTQQQQQNNTSSTTIDPAYQQASYNTLKAGQDVADNFKPVLKQAPAGFTPDQLSGFDATRAATTAGNSTLQGGVDAATAAANYKPMQVKGGGYTASTYDAKTYDPSLIGNVGGYTASLAGPAVRADSQGYSAAQAQDAQGYGAQTAQASQLNRGNIANVSTQGADQGLSSYLQGFNPSYQNDVIDASTNDLNRARILANQGTDAQAAAQGAFGGTRQAVADSLNNDNYLRAVAANSAGNRQAGFNTALNSFQTDQSRNLQGQLANQGADTTAATTNAGFGQQANLQNAQFQNDASRYGADQSNQFKLANTAATNQASAFGAQAANQASLAAAQSQNDINVSNAGAKNTAGQFNSNISLQGKIADQNSTNNAGQFNATSGNNAGQFNAGVQNDASKFGASQDFAAQQSNQDAGLRGAGVNLSAATTLGNLGKDQQDSAYRGAGALIDIGGQQQQQAQKGQDTQFFNDTAVQQAPAIAQQIRQGTLSGPYGTTTTGSGSSSGSGTQTFTPGWGSQLMQTAGNIAGTAGMVLSDKRLKTNIKPMSDPLSKLHRMKGVNYDWKPGASPAGLGFPTKGAKPIHDAGLLAQDVHSAMPGATKTSGGAMHYSAPAVLGLLAESVKALDKKVSKR